MTYRRKQDHQREDLIPSIWLSLPNGLLKSLCSHFSGKVTVGSTFASMKSDPHYEMSTFVHKINKISKLLVVKKVTNKLLDPPFIWIHTGSSWSLFWAETHPPHKCYINTFSNFCVIVLTNQQTDRGEKHNLLCGGNNDKLVILVPAFRFLSCKVQNWKKN